MVKEYYPVELKKTEYYNFYVLAETEKDALRLAKDVRDNDHEIDWIASYPYKTMEIKSPVATLPEYSEIWTGKNGPLRNEKNTQELMGKTIHKVSFADIRKALKFKFKEER